MQPCSACVLLFFAAMANGTVDQTPGIASEGGHQVAVVVGQMLERHFAGCQLVLVATTHSLLLQQINKQSSNAMGSVVVEAASLFDQEQPTQDHLLHGLWGEARHTCRALILHLTHDDDSLAFRLLLTAELWLWPETPVVILGVRSGMEASLHHPVLRNTKHILYFALHLQRKSTLNTRLRIENSKKEWSDKASVYRRCLYCNDGGMHVQLLPQWDVNTGNKQHIRDLISDRPEDFMGYEFKIVALPFFPISAFKRNSEEPGTIFTPLDSIDLRMLDSFTAHANFTYEVREPRDGQWGVDPGDGNWTGSVGALQQERADFCLVLTVNPTRIKIVEFTVPYFREPIVIFSLKPGLLPQHLAIIRPFTGRGTTPADQYFCSHLQFAPAEEQFRRVLRGSYSHITYKNIGSAIVAASFTDSRGYTPFHISRSEHIQYVGKGWGFRRGAPFRQRFSKMIQHVVEGGFVDHWLEEILTSHMKKEKLKKVNEEDEGKEDKIFEAADGRVSLGLAHLQGAFFLLLLGCGVAFLTMIGEHLSDDTSSDHQSPLLRKNLVQG
ncbi:uncharacterized protein [Panulirus ornatus]|uniref:uncharacterized protein n=1 Tax=Panulirus ornatus TaxID=150431 RepID=UPI003A871C74